MNRLPGVLMLTVAATLAGCLDFEQAYEDCYAAGDCREPRGPALTSSLPADGTNVAGVNERLTLTFDSPVNPSGFSVVVLPATDLGAPQWNSDGTEVTFPGAPRYADNTAYTVDLSGTGANGLPLEAPTTLSFRTVVDATAPAVVSATPANGQTNVSPNSSPTITFSEPMSASSVTAGISVSPDDGACTWELDSQQRIATCTHPTTSFAPDTAYTVTVSTSVTDAAGIALAQQFSYGFTTGATPDTTSPSVVSSAPSNGATAVDPAQALSVTFSEPMNTASVQAALVVVSPSGHTPVNFTWSENDTVLTFSLSPSAPLETEVSWNIGPSAQDTAGNGLTVEGARTYRTWRFVTTTLYSIATLDGEVRKYASGGELFQGYTSATVGTSTSQMVRTYLAFDLTSVHANLPVLFQDATLNLWQGTEGTNDPWAAPKGPIIAESIEYGTTLEEADYDVAAKVAGASSTISITNQVQTIYSAHTADVLAFFLQHFEEWDGSAVSPQRYAQFRVRCSTENMSTTAGWTNFKTGEAADTQTASMVVRYYAP